MAHTLMHPALMSNAYWRRVGPRADSQDAVRGILLGVLLSMAGFWLPLALLLIR